MRVASRSWVARNVVTILSRAWKRKKVTIIVLRYTVVKWFVGQWKRNSIIYSVHTERAEVSADQAGDRFSLNIFQLLLEAWRTANKIRVKSLIIELITAMQSLRSRVRCSCDSVVSYSSISLSASVHPQLESGWKYIASKLANPVASRYTYPLQRVFFLPCRLYLSYRFRTNTNYYKIYLCLWVPVKYAYQYRSTNAI